PSTSEIYTLSLHDALPIFVPDSEPGAPDADAVYYVGPNILGLEKRFAFRPLDFRRWIAIHEVTHRAQFTGVPWMREYFLSLVNRSEEHTSELQSRRDLVCR